MSPTRQELIKRGLLLNNENADSVATELPAKEEMDAIAKRCIPRIKGIDKAVMLVDGIKEG